MIIGITGTLCSGKSELGRIEAGSEKRFSLGNIAREVARKKGYENPSTEILQQLTWEESQQGNNPWLLNLEDQMWYEGHNPFMYTTIIESFSLPSQVIHYRKRHPNKFILISIDADPEFRYGKFVEFRKALGHPHDRKTFETLDAIDREGSFVRNGRGLAIDATMALADVKLINEGRHGYLERQAILKVENHIAQIEREIKFPYSTKEPMRKAQ